MGVRRSATLPCFPFDVRLDMPRSLSGNFGTEKNLFASTGIGTLDRPTLSLVIISIRPLELSCLNLNIFNLLIFFLQFLGTEYYVEGG